MRAMVSPTAQEPARTAVPWAIGGALLLFAICFYRNAWVVDEAYVFFRTTENLFDGYGLRWNVDERVAAYTSPLWLLLTSIVRLFVSNPFYGVLLLSFVTSLAAFALFAGSLPSAERWKAAVFVFCCACSKSIVDFSSSGLETPLLYLLAAGFIWWLARTDTPSSDAPAVWAVPLGMLSLAFLTRPDAVLLFGPACALLLIRCRRSVISQPLWIAAALAPAIAWCVFAWIYYGFVFPNTAYAKLFCTGLGFDDKVRFGLRYLQQGLTADAPIFVWIAIAFLATVARRSALQTLLLVGVVASFGYLLLGAASSTHMAGKLIAAPLFLGLTVAVQTLRTTRQGLAAVSVFAVFTLISPMSPLKSATSWYSTPWTVGEDFFDTKEAAHLSGAALLGWSLHPDMPIHRWYREGLALKQSPKRVFFRRAIGFVAFAAGPDKHIVDLLGLSDPLLARMPFDEHAQPKTRPGHFQRSLPEGYAASIRTGENHLKDPALRAYYELLRSATRRPIWDEQRLGDLIALNFEQGRCFEAADEPGE